MQYHTRYTITYPRKPTVGTVRFWQSRYWWLQPECSPSKVLPKTHNFFILFSKNKILPHKHHNFLSLCTAHTLISFLLSKNTAIVIFFPPTNEQASKFYHTCDLKRQGKSQKKWKQQHGRLLPRYPGNWWAERPLKDWEAIRTNLNISSHHQMNIYPDQLNSWEVV